jgi:outer membrane protein assembly factor BamB
MKESRVFVRVFGKPGPEQDSLLLVETGRGISTDEAFVLMCEASPEGRRLFEGAVSEYKRGDRIRTPQEYVSFLQRTASSLQEGKQAGAGCTSFAAAWFRGETCTWARCGDHAFLPIWQSGALGHHGDVSGVRDLEPGERLTVGRKHTLDKIRSRLESAYSATLVAAHRAEQTMEDAPLEDLGGVRDAMPPIKTAVRSSRTGGTGTAQLEMDVQPRRSTAGTRTSAGPAEEPQRPSGPQGALESVLASLADEARGEYVLLVTPEPAARRKSKERPRSASRPAKANVDGSRSVGDSAGLGRFAMAARRTEGLLRGRPLSRWLFPLAGAALLVALALAVWPGLREPGSPRVEDITEAPEPTAVPSAQNGTIAAPGTADGELGPWVELGRKWKKTFRGAVTSSPTVALGKVYFGCRDGNLYCLDAETGEEVWVFRAGAGIGSSPAFFDGNVFVGSYDGKFWSIDAVSGKKNWEFRAGGKIVSSPCVNSGRVLFGCYDRNLYCLSERDGKLRWKHEAPALVWSSPAVNDGRVFFGSADGSFCCLSLDSGKQHWREVAPGGVYSSPAVEGKVVCFGSIGKAFHFLDTSDGKAIFQIGADAEVRGSPLLVGGLAYAAADDGVMRCMSVSEKVDLWTFKAGRKIRCRPFLSDGLLFLTSYDGKLYALDASSGEKVSSFNAGAEIYSSPFVWQKKVYFGTNNGDFYCVQQKQPSP